MSGLSCIHPSLKSGAKIFHRFSSNVYARLCSASALQIVRIMSASFLSDPTPYASYQNTAVVSTARTIPLPTPVDEAGWLHLLARRWHRERRRRKVGRAYDMALEIARLIPRNSSVLDVGCGSGYIAHHLSALLGASVLGIDMNEGVEAPIKFK